MRARCSRVQGRVLWTALRFSLESCIPKSFRSSPLADVTTRALSVPADESPLRPGPEDRNSAEGPCRLQSAGIAGDTLATTASFGASLCRLGLMFRPHSGQRQGDDDSDRHLEETMERNDPGGT